MNILIRYSLYDDEYLDLNPCAVLRVQLYRPTDWRNSCKRSHHFKWIIQEPTFELPVWSILWSRYIARQTDGYPRRSIGAPSTYNIGFQIPREPGTVLHRVQAATSQPCYNQAGQSSMSDIPEAESAVDTPFARRGIPPLRRGFPARGAMTAGRDRGGRGGRMSTYTIPPPLYLIS